MTHFKLTGIIVPLLTPLEPDESLDEVSLARMIEYLLAAGIDGLLVLGSTGEFAMLDDAVKARLVERAAVLVAGRVPVLAGISAAGTRQAIEFGREAVRLGADAVVAATPYYYAHSQAELFGHFAALAAAVEKPVFLYNIPQCLHHHSDLLSDVVDQRL